jgi:hypothetical protein
MVCKNQATKVCIILIMYVEIKIYNCKYLLMGKKKRLPLGDSLFENLESELQGSHVMND